ncbi:putative spermidine/putrescine transport system permease protein [Rhodovulum imhoffii]|uniref:Putative spermidine/putrescine transport system permease protein n=1 Tax=Rhodovulum imhoffii TaxID=365340 RepID=A0A2T5BWR9_9RHOB|nr:ABC transporter permease [Rhodovulum imhoffii]MBK5933321.1 polyamine ABC transporter permease [Rhodovulum imhoffii]PTN04079.1 putative spermidine/putrescine transport system permease protein [Rhodovulum imhoffii]
MSKDGPVLAADGRPLKHSLRRALRAEKMRALALIAPLLIFILITFIAPIGSMLFRSVENEIVPDTLPRATKALQGWDQSAGIPPDEDIFAAMAYDLVIAAERKLHTRLGTRLNYEYTGISSIFRKTGRRVDDFGEAYQDALTGLNPAWKSPGTWVSLMTAPDERARPGAAAELLPETSDLYQSFARLVRDEGDDLSEERPWAPVYAALVRDLRQTDQAVLESYSGPQAALLSEAKAALPDFPVTTFREEFLTADEGWADPQVWATIQAFSGDYTSGYFLNSVDLRKTPDGVAPQPEDERIYIMLFKRTLIMSMIIMGSCVLLGYPIAYLLSNLPLRTSNLLLILVLLPFWTSLLVRTSSWKVLLQQQGVINDVLVWSGLISDAGRLVMINNQTGTIIAMTHILLPFMILPLYSVMKTIPPTYVRAAKSLGATNWTAFWRVYFPQSVPGIGAGCILVFILAIGYYITPELVGGTKGVFISNRIAYHISSSLNWGLAAALGSILLAAVLILYWVYDRLVGIDNVSLG